MKKQQKTEVTRASKELAKLLDDNADAATRQIQLFQPNLRNDEDAANPALSAETPEHDDPEPIIVEPSGSTTDRFLNCSFPWGRTQTNSEVGPEALFGSAFHAVMEAKSKGAKGRDETVALKKAARAFGIDDVAGLKQRVAASWPVLQAWLRGATNQWRIDFRKWELTYEEAIAYNVVTGEARRCALPDWRHVYVDRRENEIPMTLDVSGAGFDQKLPKLSQAWLDCNAIMVLDHKSGFSIGSPMESGQLLTLALAKARLHGVRRAFIGYLHAPPDNSLPTIYADDLDEQQLQAHADALLEAHRRRGSGLLKPGPWCKWCKVKRDCPTMQPALIDLRGKNKTAIVTPEDAGRLHERLQEFRKRFKELDGLADAELRAWIRRNGDGVRSDGREVGFVERNYSELSQTSIIEALGELRGRKEIERLRKLGCIRQGSRQELRVK